MTVIRAQLTELTALTMKVPLFAVTVLRGTPIGESGLQARSPYTFLFCLTHKFLPLACDAAVTPDSDRWQ